MDRSKAFIWTLPIVLLAIFVWLQLPICPSRVIFGIFCPGCGLTRGSLALLRGDLDAMVFFHPLAPLMGPLLGWIFLHELLVETGLMVRSERRDLLQALPKQVWIGIGVVFMIVWIARILGGLGGLPSPVFEPEQSLLFGGTWPDS